MDAPYDLRPWHDLFVGTMGAAAALLGLFFVAISLHPEHVLGHPVLRWNASISATGLSVTLIAMIVGLAPGVDPRLFGIAIIALNVVQVVVYVRGWSRPHGFSWGRTTRTVLSVLNYGWIFFAGLTMLLERWGGLYWLLPPVVFSFSAHLFVVWSLLVASPRAEPPPAAAPSASLKVRGRPVRVPADRRQDS